MNVFVLDTNPKTCAEYHCDKHVVKMILESAQMICTTHHMCYNKNLFYKIPYKKTHENHPCSRWLRDSLANYLWLFELTKHLNTEYKFRFSKDVDHKSWTAVKDLPLPNIKNIGLTVWARAMPDEVKMTNLKGDEYCVGFDDVIESYRNYYLIKKQHLLTYTNRQKPFFLL